MAIYAAGNSRRPVGNAGKARHTGKVGWLGGKHRKRGCFGITILRIFLPAKQVIAARRMINRYV